MRKWLTILALLFLALTVFCSISQALILNTPDSIWIRTTAPSYFTAMQLFWGIQDITHSGDNLKYNVYGPDGYSGPVYEDPFSTNLKTFYGKHVLFEFRAINGTITFWNDASIFGDSDVLGGMSGLSGAPFYFGFYDLSDSGDWLDREVIAYSEGQILASKPSHGNLFFTHTMKARPSNVRGGLQHAEPIPEPSTVLLLTTGLAGIAGYGKLRRKKRR